MTKAKPEKAKEIRQQALGLFQTCTTVLRSRAANTIPDARITGLAVRILTSAKAAIPDNELLNSIEIEHGSWPVILAAANAVIQALPV